MRRILSSFTTRAELTTHLLDVLGEDLIDPEGLPSPIIGSIPSEEALALQVRPSDYSRTRNFYDGAVTRLSPYIRHGLTKKDAIANLALRDYAKSTCEKFLQELAWGEFWKVAADQLSFDLWTDIELYKTGFESNDYADELPADIAKAETPNACINHFIKDLTDTGYVHNHARMYLAAYVVHFRRVKWQAGARWFMTHLLDADIASNNLSWQWVASTFSHKPYIFNLDNVEKYCGRQVNCRIEANPELAATYEILSQRLFRSGS